MKRTFSKFKYFRAYMIDSFKSLPKVIQPLNKLDTVAKVWSTAFRTPAYLLEPDFLSIFNKQPTDFPSTQEVNSEALQVREKASAILFNKEPLTYFQNQNNFKLIVKASQTTNNLLTLKPQQFTPVLPEQAADELPKNTSSGFPLFVGKKGQILDYIVNQATECFNNGISTWSNYLCTLAWRTQVRKKSLKYRIIWVTSYLSQVFENCFYSPINKYFNENKTTPWCVGNVFDDLVPRIRKLRQYQTIVVIDYSAFDLTVHPEVMLLFFKSIKSLFKINNSLWNKQFEAIVQYNVFCTTFNIMDGQPTLFSKKGSVASGSVFTNFIDSWINLFLITLYLLEHGHDPYEQCLNVMGDDCTFGFNFKFDVLHFASWIKQNFQMDIEPSKCQVLGPDFEYIEFLGSEINETERKIDEDLCIKQLCISTSFIGDSVMTREDRVFSKLASISFKFTYGYKFFDSVCAKLLPLLNLSEVPEYYTELFYSAAGPFDTDIVRRVSDYKFNGWRRQ